MKNLNPRQDPHNGQRDYQHSNQRNADNARSDVHKHHYADHDKETDDANFSAGRLSFLGEEMDFRDKEDNLEDQSNN